MHTAIAITSPPAQPSRADERREPAARRRRHPWLSDWRWGFRGRRRELRRVRDRVGADSVVDAYSPGLLLVTLTVFVLSATDAALTLILIDSGITSEANPLMDVLLRWNTHLFFGAKALVTGVGLVILVAYSELIVFRRFRMRHAIYGALGFYATLVCYEVFLLATRLYV